ncbi:hypothetical protein VaNZ11_010836 [Volvox africanus]|uniref:Uncharacterized protein n=1 Tax=Volvox africanus TaxID=51714 RepID=A0ABQ5SAA7_9CHLO|nr:hypothetical protein VaNZ11_010836 [Volvox africanus]
MDIRAMDAERLLQASKAYCRWPNMMPVRLRGMGTGAYTAKILGGFEFDLGTIFVACECERCAQKPALVGVDVKEEESSIMSVLEFAIHCGVVDLIEHRLCEMDSETVQLAASRMLPEMLFVLDVPEGGGAAAAAAGSCDAGSCTHSFGVLPLSDFLRQSAEAAGGPLLEGRQLGVFVFTSPAGAMTAKDVVSEGAANQLPNTVADAGGSASLSIGRGVEYDAETGALRVKYDTGPLLELCQDEEEEEGEGRKGATDAWIHVAVCHVVLDPDLNPDVESSRRDVDVGGTGHHAAALARRGLCGPFRGCLAAVPAQWDSPRLDPLLQRHLQPPVDNPDAVRSAATAAATAIGALPPSPAQPASGAKEGGATAATAEVPTAATAELGSKDSPATRGAEAADVAATAAAAASGAEEMDTDMLDSGSRNMAGLAVEGLTASLTLAALSDGDDGGGVAAAATGPVAAATIPTGAVEADVEMQLLPNEALEKAAAAGTDSTAAEVQLLQLRLQQLAEHRIGVVGSSGDSGGCRGDSERGVYSAVSAPGEGDVAAPSKQRSASVVAEVAEAEAAAEARRTGPDICREAAQSAEGSGQSVDGAVTVVLTDQAKAAAMEAKRAGRDDFREAELSALLERAVRFRLRKAAPPPPQREEVGGGGLGPSEAEIHNVEGPIYADGEEEEVEEGEGGEEEEMDAEVVALCGAINSLDEAMLQLGLRGPIRTKMLLCVWMMRSWQVMRGRRGTRGALHGGKAELLTA